METTPNAVMEGSSDREMTYGEKAVGLTFNPLNDPQVRELKKLYAQIIDICHQLRGVDPVGIRNEKNRYFSEAITKAEDSCMKAVKAVTYKF